MSMSMFDHLLEQRVQVENPAYAVYDMTWPVTVFSEACHAN